MGSLLSSEPKRSGKASETWQDPVKISDLTGCVSLEESQLEKIDVDRFLDAESDDDSAQDQFCKNMSEKGYAILTLNEEHVATLREYLNICGEFFSLPLDTKNKCAPVGTDELLSGLGFKPNMGYILSPQKKEYLKVKIDSDQESFPDIPQFSEKWANVKHTLETIGLRAYDIIGNHIVNGETYLPDKLRVDARDLVQTYSSVSTIHYFSGEQSAAIEAEQSQLGQSDEEQKAADPSQSEPEQVEDEEKSEEAIFNRKTLHPCSTHIDTGIMTFIICAPVPGLQVLDRTSQKFIEVEKIAEPRVDLFCIIGKKLSIFSRNYEPDEQKQTFQPTIHRVRMDMEVERTSLLYFMECRKTN